MASSSASILWSNVLALMKDRYGNENLNRLAREAKIGLGTATRIKEQKTAVRVTTLDKLATAFKLAPYQLLIENLNPKAPQLAVDRAYVATARRMAKELSNLDVEE